MGSDHRSWRLFDSAIPRASLPSRFPLILNSLSRISSKKYTLPPVSFPHARSVSSAFSYSFYISSDIQAVKTGYPPRALTLVPELPLQSLGIQRGDQIIVTEAAAAESPAPLPTSLGPQLQTIAPRPTSSPSSGPDHVQLDGSFLIHRIVPDDNSCLFSAAALVFEQSISKAQQMRKSAAFPLTSSYYIKISYSCSGRYPKQSENIHRSHSWVSMRPTLFLFESHKWPSACLPHNTSPPSLSRPPGEEPSNLVFLLPIIPQKSRA